MWHINLGLPRIDDTADIAFAQTVLRTILGFSKLYDVSAVSLPANDATSISARNLAEGVIDEVKKEILSRKERERRIKKIKILTEVN